jgi:hypothetical protein
LNFNDRQTDIAAVSQAMIGFGGYMYVLAFSQLQFTVATDNISHAFYHDPMFGAARVSLQAEARTGFYFQYFNLITGLLLDNFVGAPRSFVKFSHQYSFPWLRTVLARLIATVFESCRRRNPARARSAVKNNRNGALKSVRRSF